MTKGIEIRHESKSWLSGGYGLAPRLLMTDKTIHVTSKALFCYLSSFAGSVVDPEYGGPTSWPSRERICADLGIGIDTFTKYLRELRESGYIRVEQKRDEGKRFARNVYIICDIIEKSVGTTNEPCPKKPDTAPSDTEKPDTENKDTNSNRSLINNKKPSSNREDNSNKSISSTLSLVFEYSFKRKPSSSETKMLADLEKEYSPDWVEASIIDTGMKNDIKDISSPARYIGGVLKNWRKEGMSAELLDGFLSVHRRKIYDHHHSESKRGRG